MGPQDADFKIISGHSAFVIEVSKNIDLATKFCCKVNIRNHRKPSERALAVYLKPLLIR
jgi:hypothetical protein